VREVREVTAARHQQLRTRARVLARWRVAVDHQRGEIAARELDRERETDRTRADDRDVERTQLQRSAARECVPRRTSRTSSDWESVSVCEIVLFSVVMYLSSFCPRRQWPPDGRRAGRATEARALPTQRSSIGAAYFANPVDEVNDVLSRAPMSAPRLRCHALVVCSRA
jgi:hypothetical protein